jgi:hypothetical protein
MQWLLASLVLSVVLTVLVNLALWLFPGLRERTARVGEGFTNSASKDRRTRVIVPWKAMLVASVILTVLVNLVLWWRGGA